MMRNPPENRSGDGEWGRGGWVPVARLDQLTPDRGVCALVGGRPVAVFRLSGSDAVYALDNRCPFSGASVLSRGLVGDKAGEPKVASPVYKQSFSLRTGVCLDDSAIAVATFPVRITSDGTVEVAATSTAEFEQDRAHQMDKASGMAGSVAVDCETSTGAADTGEAAA